MGQIINNNSGLIIYLKPMHMLGRDPATVDTLLSNPLCSRLQCILLYQNGMWLISDQSKNGTFINGKPAGKKDRPLVVGDTISVASDDNNTWTFMDDARPAPVLIRKSDQVFIILSTLNLLPNEDQPELSLSCIGDEWLVEKGSDVYAMESGDTLNLKEENWIFYPNDLTQETLFQGTEQAKKNVIQLNFQISLNEENIRLKLTQGNEEIDFGYKTHHEILLLLARQCIRDNERNVPAGDHGWVSTDIFTAELGVNEYHLNTLIYRCRKAFDEKDVKNLQIERRQGEVRLSPCNLILQKGDECLKYAVSS